MCSGSRGGGVCSFYWSRGFSAGPRPAGPGRRAAAVAAAAAGSASESGPEGGRRRRLAAAMAQCVQSVQELIPDSFVPCVAALCSDEAERLTRLNHLSFAELLKPFSRLTSEGMWSPPFFTELPQSRGREKEVGGRAGKGRAMFTSRSRWSGVWG